ncbi:hypothetical protein BO86DRAFT_398582 [Aspergillus japonicus CBS 114.51]|uniref:Uncharacterized protein n=1 Tax=Aspergillus japonicus CBS 114.51 TaxID=1448312 RepID=A0A8T8X4D1_ASPJA|nr:hypothetical protein BO86DRAFT_398582 [Aspergillus japonicus CBS 114.51]RAH82895.1 hypothetical protein BO86DRAFT_398582 [Aspergillus japonicus CBS 114.51]
MTLLDHHINAGRMLSERHLASGYISRSHEDEDSIRSKNNRLDTTKNLQSQKVTLYTEYLVEENYEAPGYVLKIGTPAPDITRIKDLIRWYIASSKDQGRLDPDKKLTWIKKTLPEDETIRNIRKQKFNFTRYDFRNIVSSIWARDSPVFLHGLLKVFMYSHCKHSSLPEQGSGLL